MSEIRPEDTGGETPSVEVRIYRHGGLLAREMCESEEDAAAVVARWQEEADGIEFEVADISADVRDESVFEVEPADADDVHPIELDPGDQRHRSR